MLSAAEKDDVYMDNYSDAYFDLYVLMTTANFPDIMCVAFVERVPVSIPDGDADLTFRFQLPLS
jgi:hypothetical protein